MRGQRAIPEAAPHCRLKPQLLPLGRPCSLYGSRPDPCYLRVLPPPAGVAPPVGLGGLVATPALRSSTSGGELAFALGPAPLESESEEGERWGPGGRRGQGGAEQGRVG